MPRSEKITTRKRTADEAIPSIEIPDQTLVRNKRHTATNANPVTDNARTKPKRRRLCLLAGNTEWLVFIVLTEELEDVSECDYELYPPLVPLSLVGGRGQDCVEGFSAPGADGELVC